MFRAVARLAAVGSLITGVGVAGFSPAHADGVLGLNGPTGEPLPWTLAAVVGLGGAAFLVRAVLRLRTAPQRVTVPQRVTAPQAQLVTVPQASQAQRVTRVSGANRTAQLVSSLDSAGSLPVPNSSRASRSSA